MTLQPRHLVVLPLLMTIAGSPAPALAARLEVSGSWGRAHMTEESRLGSLRFDSMSVFREAIGASTATVPHLRLGAELAWLQRGGAIVSTTVFRPDGDGITRLDRGYLELSLSVCGAWTRGPLGFEFGVAPRLSLLTRKPWLSLAPLTLRDTILGLDPSFAISYDRFFLTTRYLWDLTPSYEHSGSNGRVEVNDTTWFVGAGLRLTR